MNFIHRSERTPRFKGVIRVPCSFPERQHSPRFVQDETLYFGFITGRLPNMMIAVSKGNGPFN